MTQAVRVALVPSPRRVPISGWAAAVVAAWLLAVGAAVWLSRAAGVGGGTLCLFRRATGVPCPTCGATRATLAAADGRLLDALLLNPMLVAAAGAGVVWLVVRLALGRRPVVHLAPAARRLAWSGVLVLVALNWAWVIWQS